MPVPIHLMSLVGDAMLANTAILTAAAVHAHVLIMTTHVDRLAPHVQ
jgi:hypothetical protein